MKKKHHERFMMFKRASQIHTKTYAKKLGLTKSDEGGGCD